MGAFYLCRRAGEMTDRTTTVSKRKFWSEYKALMNAIDRCSREGHPQYHDYGGRGIGVSPLFLDPAVGFANFLAEVGPKPHPSLTLDRVDNSRGYEPGNLAWRSRIEQSVSRRPSRPDSDYGFGLGFRNSRRPDRKRGNVSPVLPEHQGLSLSLCEWSERLDIKAATLRQRIRRGWPIEQVLAPHLFAPNMKARPKSDADETQRLVVTASRTRVTSPFKSPIES